MSLLLLPIKEANTSVMTICNQCPLRLPRMQDLKLLMLRWCSFPRFGRERFCIIFDHKGGQYNKKEQQRTIVNILRSTVGFLNATIKRITRDAKPEIQPDGSSQTRPNLRVNGYRAWFGRVWNRTKPFFRSKPRPLAAYPDPLLILDIPIILIKTEVKHHVMLYG